MKKKSSTLAIECVEIPDDDDDLEVVYVYHPSGTFDRFDSTYTHKEPKRLYVVACAPYTHTHTYENMKLRYHVIGRCHCR